MFNFCSISFENLSYDEWRCCDFIYQKKICVIFVRIPKSYKLTAVCEWASISPAFKITIESGS